VQLPNSLKKWQKPSYEPNFNDVSGFVEQYKKNVASTVEMQEDFVISVDSAEELEIPRRRIRST